MLTIITFEELEKLYRDRKIEKSDSFDFLNPSTQKFLADVFKEKNEVPMADMIYVHSVDGEAVSNVKSDIIADQNDSFMSYLPLLEGEQICLVVTVKDKLLKFNDIVLDELDSSSIATEEEGDFFKEILLADVATDSSCVYAVARPITLDEVEAILYPEELEEKVNGLKEENKERDVLFKTTSLFS